MILSGRKATLAIGALAVSVCLNLFLGAMALGHLVGPGDRRSPGYGIERFVSSLPDEAREQVRARFAEHHAEAQEKFQALRGARRRVAEVLAAEPFDRQALDRAFAELRERSEGAQAATHSVFGDAVADLPPSARKAMAGDWEKRRGP